MGSTQYYIEIGIKLGKNPIKCLIDTGACTSHITIDLVQGLPIRELENKYYYLDYYNNKKHITHKVDVVLIIKDCELPLAIEVEDSVSTEFLLGMDFLGSFEDYTIKDKFIEIIYNGKTITISRV